jgi:hypothetical protein
MENNYYTFLHQLLSLGPKAELFLQSAAELPLEKFRQGRKYGPTGEAAFPAAWGGRGKIEVLRKK